MKIEIMSTEVIRPSSPTPTQLRDFKLSFIDERIPPLYNPVILFYNFKEDHEDIKKLKMSHLLKSSLSDALVHFYPLAGRMIKGHSLVDCNDEGISYIEANVDAKMLDVVNSPDSVVLDQLIPFKSNGCVSSAEEQLAVQATSFSCGGIAIGICISHRIADGSTLSSFLKCWAAIACGDHNNVVSPVFNSSTLFPPQNIPDFRPNSASPSVHQLATKTLMKRFVFTSSAIGALKTQVTQNSSIITKPTRVEVVTAFLWKCLMMAKRLKNSDKSVVCHPLNLRSRIPTLKENSFGNLFQMISAENIGSDQTSWIHLVEKLRAAFGKISSNYVKRLLGEKGFELAKENFMEIGKYLALGNVAVFRFGSACGFPIYEADFGWGKPVWVSGASYVIKDNIFLMDSVEWPGGIEALIVLADQDMERLQQDLELQHFTSSCLLNYNRSTLILDHSIGPKL